MTSRPVLSPLTAAVVSLRGAFGSSMDMPRKHKSLRITCIVLGAAGAGKTCLLRRYFTGVFDAKNRSPTLGSDFYTGRVRNPLYSDKKKENGVDGVPYVNIQFWDTAGQERKAKYTSSLSDEFIQHADATMLVYDATSSTSFTQLIRWHSDLMNRMEHLDGGKKPVLIVANKMDIIEKMEKAKPGRRKSKMPQRDVLGLAGRNFKGKDMRYEYHVSKPRKGRSIQTSYMATGDSWTSDGSYLDSVIHSEDGSHADREMVMLWCMRNGLKHLEVSALTGTSCMGGDTLCSGDQPMGL